MLYSGNDCEGVQSLSIHRHVSGKEYKMYMNHIAQRGYNITDLHMQTTVTSYFLRKQQLLFAFREQVKVNSSS